MILPNNYEVSVYKDSVPVEKLVKLSVSQKSESKGLYEFHNSEPYAYVDGKTSYEIYLETYSGFFTEDETGFTLLIDNPDAPISYSGCSVSSVQSDKDSRGKVLNKIRISAGRKELL